MELRISAKSILNRTNIGISNEPGSYTWYNSTHNDWRETTLLLNPSLCASYHSSAQTEGPSLTIVLALPVLSLEVSRPSPKGLANFRKPPFAKTVWRPYLAFWEVMIHRQDVASSRQEGDFINPTLFITGHPFS